MALLEHDDELRTNVLAAAHRGLPKCKLPITPIADRIGQPHPAWPVIELLGRPSVGIQRHREQGQMHGSAHQHITAQLQGRLEGQPTPAVFQTSEYRRIEQVMRSNLIEFTAQVGRYDSTTSVLNALDVAIAEDISLMVLGAKRFGVNLRDRGSLKLGENVFIHKSVPTGWWDAYLDLSREAYAPIIMMARHCLAPYTWTECLRMFEP